MTLARRAFLGCWPGAWHRGTRAQAPGAPHRIGWLSEAARPDPFVDGFREGSTSS